MKSTYEYSIVIIYSISGIIEVFQRFCNKHGGNAEQEMIKDVYQHVTGIHSKEEEKKN